jgi:ABC-type sugar transport system ATPase subunit
VRYRVPRQAVRDGIVYITEDRKLDGFFETMTADDNVYLGYLASPKGQRILYSLGERKTIGDRWTKALSISALNRSLKIIEYSGGNQQKLVVAKSLVQEPSVVIFDEPTRGVDVGAIPQIHAAIRALAAEGKAVIVISSYLPEVLSISDRILVARGGRIVEEMATSEATEEKIMYAAIH